MSAVAGTGAAAHVEQPAAAHPSRGATPRHPVALVDVAALALGAAVGYFARSLVLPDRVFEPAAVALAATLLVGAWTLALAVAGGYDKRILGSGSEEYRRVLTATVIVVAVVSTVSYLFKLEVSRGLVLIQIPIGLALLLAGRLVVRRWLAWRRANGEYLQRTVVVGDERRVDELVAPLLAHPELGYEVVSVAAPPSRAGSEAEWLDDLMQVLLDQRIGAVMITSHELLDRTLVRELGWRLETPEIDLLVAPDFLDVGGPRTTVRDVAGLPLIHLDEPHLSGPKRFAKRTIDVAVASAGVVLLAPVLAMIALVVRLTSDGPALFRQARVGLNGRSFMILKFRTMTNEASLTQDVVWAEGAACGMVSKHPDDPRVTPVGRTLRRWSLDELPQLFNVLAGDMSLVGPRPLQPAEVAMLPGHHARRLIARPGMTGLWQVRGRNDLDWDQRMALDLHYVETWSVTGDVAILASTLRAVVERRGAY